MQLARRINDWLRSEACNQLNKIVRKYCGDGKLNIEYKTFPSQLVGDKAIKRLYLYDAQGDMVTSNVSVVTWTQELEDEANPPLTGVSISHFQVVDGSQAGTTVGELCGIGGFPGYTFTILSDPSNKFTIVNGDQLTLSDTVDVADSSYFVTIEVEDALGSTSSSIFEVLVTTTIATGTFQFSGLSTGGVITELALTDAAWVAIPASSLTNRNSIAIQNISGNGNIILWNYSNSAPATEGWRIEDGGFKSVAITDGITVYARMLSGNGTAAIDEVA